MINLICFMTGIFIGIFGVTLGIVIFTWLPIVRNHRRNHSNTEEPPEEKRGRTPEEQLNELLSWQPNLKTEE